MESKKEVSTFDRLYYQGLKTKENIKELSEIVADEKVTEELHELTGTPKISQNSVKLLSDRSREKLLDRLYSWNSDKEKKLDQSRQDAQSAFQPTLVNDHPPNETYANPIVSWKQQGESYFAKKLLKREETFSHQPDINAVSKQIWQKWTDEPLEERMERVEQERQQKIRKAAELKELLETEHTFKPKTNDYKGMRPNDVSLHLYNEGFNVKRHQAEKRDIIIAKEFSYTPRLSQRSLRLAKVVKSKRSMTPTNKSYIRTPRHDTSARSFPVKTPPLTPKRLEQFIDRNYTAPLSKTQTIKFEDPECTFQPNSSQKTMSTRDISPTRLYDSGRVQKEEREVFMKIKRQQNEDSEYKQCTFRPELKRYVPSRSVSPTPRLSRSRSPTPRSTASKDKDANKVQYIDSKKGKYMLTLRSELIENISQEFDKIEDQL